MTLYWGLRDYGTGSWVGGDPDCDHTKNHREAREFVAGNGKSEGCLSWTKREDQPYADMCGKCGATRVDRQLGLEPTPEAYVENMVAVFREVRRVLRRDGTLWLNIGDSYAQGHGGSSTEGKGITIHKTNRDAATPRAREDVDVASWSTRDHTPRNVIPGLKPKDLVGIPWKLAFALQADGWYLRADIIWSKPNPMPESVTDRPTKAHEYVFLLAKSPRYFYDADAIREPYEPKTLTHRGNGKAAGKVGRQDGTGKVASGNFGEWDKPRTAYPPPKPQEETLDGSEGEAPRGPDGRRVTVVKGGEGSLQHRDGERWPNDGRNKRTVWEIATEPFSAAHFATFPTKLVEPCILAGTSEYGCCPECGAPWERETDVNYERAHGGTTGRAKDLREPLGRQDGTGFAGKPVMNKQVTTTGWRPTCVCALDRDSGDPGRSALAAERHGGQGGPKEVWPRLAADVVPCVVLDPFMGSGTTALVSRKLGRRSVGIELSPEYAALCARRLSQLSLEFA